MYVSHESIESVIGGICRLKPTTSGGSGRLLCPKRLYANNCSRFRDVVRIGF